MHQKRSKIQQKMISCRILIGKIFLVDKFFQVEKLRKIEKEHSETHIYILRFV